MMPRVHRVTKNGQVFKYHRVSRVPLPSGRAEDSEEFVAAWQAAEKGEAPKRTRAVFGSVQAGIELYLENDDFKNLSDGYRPVIRRHVDKIKEQCDEAPEPPMLGDLRPQDIQDDIDVLRPAVAASRLKAWRKLTKFWKRKGMISSDIGKPVERKPIPQSDGHKEWTTNDLEQFRDRWVIGTPERLAGELFQWTGARCSDAARLGPGMVGRDGLLKFTQKKTKVEVNVPWTAPAFGLERQRADLMACLKGHDAMVFVMTKFGRARSEKAASQWFSEKCNDAGLFELTAHGLRKYRMNQLAEAGAPVLGMQAWVGHLTLKEVQEYTKRAERRNVFFVNQPTQFTNLTPK